MEAKKTRFKNFQSIKGPKQSNFSLKSLASAWLCSTWKKIKSRLSVTIWFTTWASSAINLFSHYRRLLNIGKCKLHSIFRTSMTQKYLAMKQGLICSLELSWGLYTTNVPKTRNWTITSNFSLIVLTKKFFKLMTKLSRSTTQATMPSWQALFSPQ